MKPYLLFVYACNLCLLTGIVSAKPIFAENSLRKDLSNGQGLERAAIMQDSLSMNVNMFQGQDKFTLHMAFENYLTGKVSIELISEDGSLSFYKTIITEKTFRRTIHLYNLPVGTYTIEVKNKNDSYTKRIVIALSKGKRSCLVE